MRVQKKMAAWQAKCRKMPESDICVCRKAKVVELHISRVSNQNGVSLLYIMVEIHHSGREPSIYMLKQSKKKKKKIILKVWFYGNSVKLRQSPTHGSTQLYTGAEKSIWNPLPHPSTSSHIPPHHLIRWFLSKEQKVSRHVF